jgi:broad specificity phosphatase PhoE
MHSVHHPWCTMAKRITVTIDDALHTALAEAPARLGLPDDASESERLREWARLGYQRALEEEMDRQRLATYEDWAGDPEFVAELVAESDAALRLAAESGLFEDE